MYLPHVKNEAFLHHWESNEWQLVIKCFQGFEDILVRELADLGGRSIERLHRAVQCTGDLGFLYKANYSLHTALNVLVNVAQFRASDPDDLYKQASTLDWGELIEPDQSFAIRFTVNSGAFSHSQYAALRLKDAIVDAVRRTHGRRPNIDRHKPDLHIDLMIAEEQVIVSLDASGAPLFKRGYRSRVGKAPLNEVLAAGLVKLTAWDGERPLYDPFCGSGTLLVEACMQHARMPSGVFRQHFAFENWPNFESNLFEHIKESRLDRIVEPRFPILGSDRDEGMMEKAERNLHEARLEDVIELHTGDFFHDAPPEKPGIIMTNPPYGKKIRLQDEGFFHRIGDRLKQQYPGWQAWILLPKEFKSIGLRHSRRFEVLNADIPCRWTKYELFEGSKKGQKAD